MSENKEYFPTIDSVQKSLYEKSLSEFIKSFWYILEPDNPYTHNWHVDAICDHLEAVSRGDIKRLIITMPPRMAKSLIVSVFWPVWTWTWKPSHQWLCGSYASNLSVRDNMKRRRIIESELYQSMWGDKVKLLSDQNKKDEFGLTSTGHSIAVSVGSSSTGKGCNTLIVDDANKAGDANSTVKLESATYWFDNEMTTRLNDKRTGSIVIVQQRLSDKDLAGHLIEKGSYDLLILPMEYEENGVQSNTSLGYVDPRIDDGELLFEERFPDSVIKELKTDLGSIGYASQYQQSPVPTGGNMVSRDWFRYYRALPEFDYILHSWDFTFKESKTSDYVAGGAIGVKGANKYILPRIVHDKMNFVPALNAIKSFTAYADSTYGNHREVVIEAKANGEAIINSVSDVISGVVPFHPKDSKEARASSVAPQIEAGNIFLPDPLVFEDAKHWVDDFVTEWVRFPYGAHDDYVDFLSQALLRIGKTPSWLGLTDADIAKAFSDSEDNNIINKLFNR